MVRFPHLLLVTSNLPASPTHHEHEPTMSYLRARFNRIVYRNDILRQHGIIPEKPKDPEPLIQEALIEAEHRAYENRLEDKDIDELDALEDEEDEGFLQQYR
jgi:hypothetical protein